jgi:two-component system sensor histidine kinase PilS (NtrC family)
MPPSERRRRLAWLIVIRAIISTLLLGSGPLIQLSSAGTLPVSPFYFLIGLSYGVTAVFGLALPYADRWQWLADAQLICDAFVISGFIVITGGVTSYFSLLYVLPIIGASSLMRHRGALTVAIFSSLIYATLVLAQYDDRLGAFGSWFAAVAALPPARVAEYTVGINIFSFLAVAVLSGSLAERLRHAGARLERASTEIANLQAFNQDVIDSLTSGLVTTDITGRILSFNHAAEAITGHTFDAVVGRRVAEVLHLPEEIRRALSGDGGGSRARRAEYPYTTASGRAIEIGLAAADLLTPGGKLGFLLTFQDITEIKRMERDARLRQRLAAVGEMAAGIAHEIRNPLASISGSIQVLREELALSEEQAQLLDIVLRESKRLNETIRSFLAYARPQRLAINRLDLRKTVGDTAMLLRNSAEVQAGHVVDVNLPPDPVWYDADEGQISQIIWNLATNGLRAMPSGGRLGLSVSGERGAPAAAGPQGDPADDGVNTTAILEVQDEGVGIPADQLDGIFQPFHSSFKRGTGLGLAIVQRIVSDYGGEIQVTSSVGSGTTVRVRLGAVKGQVGASTDVPVVIGV